MTASYAFTDRITAGLEANPLDDDYGLIANWRVLDETAERPALVLGTSSDRIGTVNGRAYYGTFSKDLEGWTGLPVSPYVGASFGESDDEWRVIAGTRIRWAPRWGTSHLWDGVNFHHLLDHTLDGGVRAGLLVAEQDGTFHAGLTLSISL